MYPSKTLTLKEAGFDEAWLQNQICENPGIIGLGDLRLIAKEKIISSGGRLDILLQDADEEKLYEVEVQLGDTDPSHIIRTIEYWDLIRKKYPSRAHYAVLIAEGITKRFFNVISLLSANIPIIAIKCSIIEIENKRSLIFTEILNSYDEPEEISNEQDTKVDSKYWESLSPKTLLSSKMIFDTTKDLYSDLTLELNKWCIALKSNGYNQIRLNRRSGDQVQIEMKYGKSKEEIFKILKENGLQVADLYKQARFTVSIEWIEKNLHIIKQLCQLNNGWWKNENDA